MTFKYIIEILKRIRWECSVLSYSCYNLESPVCQRGDDKSSCISQILVAVNELGINGANVKIVVFEPIIPVRCVCN